MAITPVVGVILSKILQLHFGHILLTLICVDVSVFTGLVPLFI